jgi:hypothetical protein
MGKKDGLTKILAVAGTVLVWLPILAPVFFTAVLLVSEAIFRFDFLMPAEIFPVALVGGILLAWAAVRARRRLKLIAWSLASAVFFLIVSQGVAVLTGLATGANEATGWRIALLLATYAIFPLALVAAAIGGILLLRDLFQATPPTSEAPPLVS